MEYKDKTTMELLELSRDEKLSDTDNMAVWEELNSRSPFDYYNDQFKDIENNIKKLQKQVDDIGTLVAVNHKLNTILSKLDDALKPRGRPPLECPMKEKRK